ncbi:hypothetical protein J6590_092723 [Homalodisca vitripennis]|nr:hypothetical protein J6590_092723 [Homalodisca vitripennis]
MSSVVSLYTYPQGVSKFSMAPDLPSVFEEIRFTLEEEDTFASVWPQILACLCAASYHIANGFILGFSAILIPQIEAVGSEIHFNKHEISWITSVVPLVIPVASLITGFMVDRIGRLHTIRFATIPNTVGWLFLATANNFPLLMVGRVLTGFSVDMYKSKEVESFKELAFYPSIEGQRSFCSQEMNCLATPSDPKGKAKPRRGHGRKISKSSARSNKQLAVY